MKRFARFNLVGLIGAGVQVLLVAVLAKFLNSAAATALAVEITLLHNFIWHERFTWMDRRQTSFAARLWRFHLGNGLISLAGNTVVVYGLVERAGVPVALAAVAAIGVCSVFNFWIADRWVYAKSSTLPATPFITFPPPPSRAGLSFAVHRSDSPGREAGGICESRAATREKVQRCAITMRGAKERS